MGVLILVLWLGPPMVFHGRGSFYIHLVIVLLLLLSFNLSYHVLLLLSRLAFVATVAPLGVSLIDPLGAQGPPYGVSLSWFLFHSSCHRLASLVIV